MLEYSASHQEHHMMSASHALLSFGMTYEILPHWQRNQSIS